MHQQIKGSPDDIAGNVRRVVAALAKHGINIEAIAPDFDAPHVRVLVEHGEPYDPNDETDTFNKALAAMEEDGLAPQIKPAITLSMPNKPRVLKAAMDRLTREGYEIESILVMPGNAQNGNALVSFGVARTTITGWDTESDDVASRINEVLESLPDT